MTVGNLNDVVNGTTTSIAALIATPGADGISLREAILASNSDSSTADTINFSVSGVIQLTNVGHVGEIVINNNLTINGPGASLLTVRAFAGTAAAGDGARIFNVDDGTGTVRTVAISGLTLTGGDVASILGGGAISNRENLTVTALTITGNSAGSTTTGFHGGGIVNSSGSLAVNASTISGNTVLSGRGGGIYSTFGTMTISQSTISGNSASSTGNGGGVYSNYSTTTIDSSTISNNTANTGGGGVQVGIGRLMTITNSTISENQARVNGGGVVALFGDVSLRHSTITLNRADSDSNGTGNGGGVFVNSVASNATIDHTIVAGNLRQVSTRSDVFGAVGATSAFNFVGVNTGLTGISQGTNGNQIGTAGSPINALLRPLENNSGPTLTHALLAGSPAIDAGNPTFSPPPANDQRGNPLARVFDGDGSGGARIDIGAYERQTLAGINLIVDTLSDEDDLDYSAGDLSLREAIGLANQRQFSADTITFAASLTSGGPATILLTQGELKITDALTINGPSANLLTIDASGNDPTPATNNSDGSRVFNIDDGSSTSSQQIEILGLKLAGGDINGRGGAIQNSESLVVRQSTISGNNGGSRGGGIASVQFGGLTVTDSTISGNSSQYGGGIYSDRATHLTVINTTISGNTAFFTGGGIWNSNNFNIAIVRHSTITGNTVSTFNGRGSGILTYDDFHPNGSITLDHTIVAGNRNVDISFGAGEVFGPVFANFSLIGIGEEFLGPLADNGGPTMTHALLFGSPAIDAGDTNFDPADPDSDPLTDDAVPYDQRGVPFGRVFDGNSNGSARIDIGAYELQPKSVLGDYNSNGVVDAADYVVWRKTLGTSVAPPFIGADGDGDSSIDPGDHGVWRANFGNVLPPPGSGANAPTEPPAEPAAADLRPGAVGFAVESTSMGASARQPPALPGVGDVRGQETRAQQALADPFALSTVGQAMPDILEPDIVVPRQAQPDVRPQPIGQISSLPSRARLHRYSLVASGGDDLTLLLAIDRVSRSPRHDSVVSGGSDSDKHCIHNGHSEDLQDGLPAAALEASL